LLTFADHLSCGDILADIYSRHCLLVSGKVTEEFYGIAGMVLHVFVLLARFIICTSLAWMRRVVVPCRIVAIFSQV